MIWKMCQLSGVIVPRTLLPPLVVILSAWWEMGFTGTDGRDFELGMGDQ